MPDWQDFLAEQQRQDYFRKILSFVEAQRRAGKIIYPPDEELFNAFKLTPVEQVKVVILGQDPYHAEGQAHGLCFSVKPGVKTPPSLQNIYKELARDIEGFSIPAHGCLSHWAKQGVLLLNTVLSVEQGKPHSHAKIGWEVFTDKVIQTLNEQCEGLVFLLWGNHAHKKGRLIDRQRHHVLESVHPSPLSAHRGFLGCGHFSQTNALLQQQGKSPVDWQLPAQAQ